MWYFWYSVDTGLTYLFNVINARLFDNQKVVYTCHKRSLHCFLLLIASYMIVTRPPGYVKAIRTLMIPV